MIQHEVFNEMLNNPVRELKGRVELYIYKDGSVVKVCGTNDALKSWTIERVGENKFFGYGICHRLNVKLLDLERNTTISSDNYIEAVFGVDNDYVYPFPAFYVTEVNRDETTNQLSVTAYDGLYKANKHTVSELELTAPYTIRQFVTACADLIGLPLNLSTEYTAFDLNYPQGANFNGNENIRDALNAVAEVTQTIYFVDRNWELTFKTLDRTGEPVLTIGKSNYFKLDSKTNRRLKRLTHIEELGDNVTAEVDGTGSTQYMRSNPFLTARTDVNSIMQNAINKVGGLEINQFTCNWRGNWLLEIGDKIEFVTKDNNTITSYFLNDVLSFDGSLSEKTQWHYDNNEEETVSNPSTIGEAIRKTYATVDKLTNEVSLFSSEITRHSEEIGELKIASDNVTAKVEENHKNVITRLDETDELVQSNTTAIGQLQIKSDNISASVERVAENTTTQLGTMEQNIATITDKVSATMTADEVEILVSTSVSRGANNVTTTTGFTFDEEGLTVSKSDSEMETQITEDGMTVYRNDEAMLVADNQGVVAHNLRSNYIIISNRCRFEKYGTDRAGCFWLGGEE